MGPEKSGTLYYSDGQPVGASMPDFSMYAQGKEYPYQSVWNWMIFERPTKKGR